LAQKYPGQVKLVVLGPLTNLAIAVRLCPELPKLLQKVMVMGGCAFAKGNVSYCAEFNFWSDPESVNVCLEEFDADKFSIFPWELTQDCCLSWEEFEHLLQRIGDTKKGNLLRDMCVEYRKHSPVFGPCDAYAMTALLFESSVLETQKRHCIVETSGKHTRGMLLIDWYNIAKEPANATIITKFDRSFFIELLVSSFSK
jgi:purine nucleosidase